MSGGSILIKLHLLHCASRGGLWHLAVAQADSTRQLQCITSSSTTHDVMSRCVIHKLRLCCVPTLQATHAHSPLITDRARSISMRPCVFVTDRHLLSQLSHFSTRLHTLHSSSLIPSPHALLVAALLPLHLTKLYAVLAPPPPPPPPLQQQLLLMPPPPLPLLPSYSSTSATTSDSTQSAAPTTQSTSTIHSSHNGLQQELTALC